MESQKGYAAVNGTRLYYEVAGAGHPLVLLHGFSLDTRMWDDQFAAFAQRYRVVRYDARGFGQSAPPVEGVSYTHRDDLRALLSHLGITSAHVLGLSMGGAIAVTFALAYPEATTALVLVASVLFGMPMTSPFSAASAAREGGVAAARAEWLNSPLFAPAQEHPDIAGRLRAIIDTYSGWHWLHADPHTRSRSQPSAAQRLGEIRVPTLVVVGDRDTPDLLAASDALAAGIPHARKVVIPDVGHMANMEAPEQVNALVLEFLGEAKQTRHGPRVT
jgi:3-oxoadipate enol-lactonase